MIIKLLYLLAIYINWKWKIYITNFTFEKEKKIKQQELKHFSYVYRIEKNINI